MIELKGKGYTGGKASGAAMVTKMPMNFTGSFTKPQNIMPGRRSEVRDRHHDLFQQNLRGKVLVFPAAIGSTFTGMVLFDLMYMDSAPCALIIQSADSLTVSGAVLADVWYDKGVPIVEYTGDDLFEKISNGSQVEVDGDTGKIRVK